MKQPSRKKNAPPVLAALFLFLFCFSIYSLTHSGRFYGYEGGTLHYFRDLIYSERISHMEYETSPTPAGMAAVMAYFPMEILNMIFVDPGNTDVRNFISLQTLPLFSSLIVLIFYLIALEIYRSKRVAILLSLLAAFTTMFWPYSKIGMELHHTLWIMLAIYLLLYWRRTGQSGCLFLSGFCAGMILHTKIYGFISTGALAVSLWFLSQEKRSRTASMIRFLTPVAILLLLLLISNSLRFGGGLVGARYDPGYEAKLIPFWEGLAGYLFSPGKSVFIYNPVLVVSLFFFVPFFRRFPGLKALYLPLFAFGLLFQSSLWIWTDECWGPRKLHFLIPLSCLPLGIMIEEFGKLGIIKRILIFFCIFLGVAIQILGISVSYLEHTEFLRKLGRSNMEEIRYNQHLSHTRVNRILLKSTIDRYLTGKAQTFSYRPTYIYNIVPDHPERTRTISLYEMSKFDFWFVDNRPIRKGGLHLSPGRRIYFSLLILAAPLFLGILYILIHHKDGKKGAPFVVPLVFCSFGLLLCILYNISCSGQYREFHEAIRDRLDIPVGDETKDRIYLGQGWRYGESYDDPGQPGEKTFFRWTNAGVSKIFLPCLPDHDYRLGIQLIWVYPTPLSIWINGHRVGYIRGNRHEKKNPTFRIPSAIIGNDSVCEVIIQNHQLHVPSKEEPGKSGDSSRLGVMVTEVTWEKTGE